LQNGRYVVLKRLGEDGTGDVYKARDTVLNRIVALKVLKGVGAEGEAYSRFLAEARVVGKLDHPNIVSVYGFGKEDSKQFFVLELVDGESLRDLMGTYPEGKCDVQVVLRIAMDVCRALQHAHSNGVFHQGISPENIVVTKEGVAKLTGFCSAMMLGHPSMTSQGTLAAPGRVATGVVEVDNLLLGGILENHSVIMASPSCEKRDFLVRRFLETGARSGEATFYLTIDPGETKALIREFQSNLCVFVCNPRADTIIESLPNVCKLKGVENLTEINIALVSAFNKMIDSPSGPRRACIEIISDVLLQHRAVTTRKWLAGLLPELGSKRFVTLGVMNPHMHPSEDVQAILGLFNGEISISERETEKGLEGVFNVRRIFTQEQLQREFGPVAYLAPELALGKPGDARSDLYSFGAVLYEMLAGRPPFSGSDPVKAVFSHVYEYSFPVGRLNPTVPVALADCVMRLLEKEPEKRYQTAADLFAELKEITREFSEAVSRPSVGMSAYIPAFVSTAKREASLVDRVEEMDALREAVDSAIRGKGGLVLVSGEAGVGKTRLTRELSAYAHLRGMRVLNGRYPALFTTKGVPPYVLWSEVIKGYLKMATQGQMQRVIGSYPAEVCKLVPEVKQKLVAVPQSMSISPEHEQQRLFEAVSLFIANVSRDAPLLIVLDDLHWADQSSLMLLHYLARGIHNEPLLIMGAYRDSNVNEKHPLYPVLTELNRERLVHIISLRHMTINETARMVKQVLERDDVPEEFCRLIYQKTGGNPYFVEEVIRSLEEERVIYREEKDWKLKDVSNIELPQSVRSIVKSRIEKLDDECQNVLVTASAVGERFTFDVLRQVVKMDENRLFDVMEKILKTGVVEENVIVGEDIYSFSDVVVRDVLNEEISHLRRKKLHAAVGLALERVYGNKAEQHSGELAYHFLEGGDEDKTLDYLLKAGEKAGKVYAHDEAYSYLHQAVELMREKGDSVAQEASVMEKLGDIKAWVGESEVSIQNWNRSLKLWAQVEDLRSVSRVNCKMAHLFWETVGNREEASQRHLTALEILENEPESTELANLYEDVSRMLWRGGKHAEALPWAQKALAIAQRLGDAEVAARSYASLGALSLFEGDYDRAIQTLEEGVKIAVENNCVVSLRLYQNLGNAYFGKGDFQRTFETCQKGFELAKKVGDVSWITWNGYLLATTYVFMGEIEKAVALFEEALALDRKVRNSTHIVNVMSSLGNCYGILGDWDKSLQCLTEAVELSKKIEDYQVSGYANRWLGELYVEMENFAEAERYIRECDSIYEKAGDTMGRLCETFPALSKLYLKRGEIARAEELIEKTYEYALKAESKTDMADAETLKGMLFREMGKWGESIQHFENGLQRYQSMDAQKWYVHKFAELLYEFSLAYLGRDEKGDRERAYVLLDRCLETHKRMGAKKRIEKIEAKKRLLIA
jgi:serine/threonine protein kinase/tetratricopeptide (TPR) repeat protein